MSVALTVTEKSSEIVPLALSSTSNAAPSLDFMISVTLPEILIESKPEAAPFQVSA